MQTFDKALEQYAHRLNLLRAAQRQGWSWTKVEGCYQVRYGETLIGEVASATSAEDLILDRHIIAAPDLITVCQAILARLDLEALERGQDAPFMCATLREPLRAALAAYGQVDPDEVPF